MKYETSAGGVIVSRRQGKWFVLMLKDKSGNWTFPKGLIEKGEVIEKTAEREIAEEVGLRKLKFIAALAPVQYFYKWEGKLVKKTVHYFVFEYAGKVKPQPQHEEGILEVKWFEKSEALTKVGYPKTNTNILHEALDKLRQAAN
jgi:8-oxo-dGTP pyrophosphatase MutT (NUDIX family)